MPDKLPFSYIAYNLRGKYCTDTAFPIIVLIAWTFLFAYNILHRSRVSFETGVRIAFELACFLSNPRSKTIWPYLELEDLVDPFTELGDSSVDAWLVRYRATDSPADHPGKDPSFIARPLYHHWPSTVTLREHSESLDYFH